MLPVDELAGVTALAIVVVREAFLMVRNVQTRRNGTGHDQVIKMLQDEIARLRDQMLTLNTAVATIQGELIRWGRKA